MKSRQEALSKIVMEDPDVATVAMAIGGSGRAGNNGNLFITLKPRNERKANAQQIISRLRPKLEAVPGARLYMQAAQDVRLGGRPTRTQFEFTLQDANLAELNEWAPKVLARMQTLPELRDVATDQQATGTTLTLTINRDTASRYGIYPQLIDDTLYDAFGQRQVTQYFTQLNSYHVILEILPELQGKLDTLDKLYIKSPTTGDQVPLATFASWTSVPVRPLSISHQGQFPAITISFNLAQGVALGQATDAVQRSMADLGTPATLNSSFQGTAQAFQQSLGTVPLLILAALIVVYLILGILYESYIHPITILSTLPSAGVGALAILMAFGYDFSLIALIGIILLIGIVKKNGIMMVDFAIAAEREEHLSPEQSIRKAALLRFRPIMMTTMAAMLGGVPLMLGTGTGSEIRQPLGYAMVGGLIVSQALTLFTTPVVYLYLDRLSNAFSGWGRSEPAKGADDAAEHGSVKEAAE
jgi:HAE1 family hydrophobic/amphiphilic exporter-1